MKTRIGETINCVNFVSNNLTKNRCEQANSVNVVIIIIKYIQGYY